jgi:UDP-N-acetylmuramyl pentapeptide synthase
MIPLSLGEIAAVVGGAVEGDGAVTVTAPAVLDGRQAEPGGLFAAFAGEHADGHDYAGQAREAGAVALLGSRPTPLPTVVVNDAQAALQALAAHVVARLRDGLTGAGLTGSQGKTSTKDPAGNRALERRADHRHDRLAQQRARRTAHHAARRRGHPIPRPGDGSPPHRVVTT